MRIGFHCNSDIFKNFIKNTYFYAVKQKIENGCILPYYFHLHTRCGFSQARRLLVKQN